MPSGSAALENLAKLELSRENYGLFKKCIENPASIDQRSWKSVVDCLSKKTNDVKYGRIAAKVCSDIVQSEIKNSKEGSEKYFRKLLLNQLQVDYKRHADQNYRHENSWLGFVSFLCAIFDLLHINNMPLMALLVPVYDVLQILATVPSFAKSDTAVQCLVTQLQFIGEELDKLNKQKMDVLINDLRNLFLSTDTTQLSRLMILEIIELRSGQWKLSPAAYEYYYEVPAK